jgi:hypothetical protein
MSLQEFASRDDNDNSGFQDIALSQSTGTIKVKKSSVSVPMPAHKEGLRKRMKLIEAHFWYLKLRYPHRRDFQNLGQRTFEKYTNYVLGDHVADFVAKDADGHEVSRPSFKLILSYEFEMRKYMVRKINDGMGVEVALQAAMRDTTLKERFFTTPCAMAGVSHPQQYRGRSRSPTAAGSKQWRSASSWNYNSSASSQGFKGKGKHHKGKGGKSRGKQGGKGGDKIAHRETPDRRPICFAYNSPFERCKGNCGFVHVCRICFEPHPMHMHDASKNKSKGKEGARTD